MNKLVSLATQKNWNRLLPDTTSKLKSRANKKRSTKLIIPLEYISTENTLNFINYVSELKDKYRIQDIIYTVAYGMLVQNRLEDRKSVVEVLERFEQDVDAIEISLDCEIPEFSLTEDIIGAVYQSLLSEGEKNTNGSYYTPNNIVNSMIDGIHLDRDSRFLDPCCGSGAFLLNIYVDNPIQLYGIEKDRVAAFIASVNLILKYRNVDFVPNIKCSDFLLDNELFGTDVLFDVIATNPPWGSKDKVVTDLFPSKESFSQFFVKSYIISSPSSTLSFLFPESILNVKAHKDIRKFILERQDLQEIRRYSSTFTGVVTNFVSMKFIKSKKTSNVLVSAENKQYKVYYSSFAMTENKVFSLLMPEEKKIIETVLSFSEYSLSQSQWALGIVTGNNKAKLLSKNKPGLEKIYTGKEIVKYKLKEAQYFILYDRNSFQQVAKDEIYRADEKLVYKFVSNKLMFAYDDTSSLFLNSANILIPDIPGMSIKTVLAFLNSSLYQFIYEKLFGELKVLKGNLSELPFPKIDKETDLLLSQMVDMAINSDKEIQNEIDNIIFNLFGFESNILEKL